MQSTKAVLFLALTASFLTGCADSYRTDLEQKLEGKSPQERRTILLKECNDEISKGIKPDNPDNVRHFDKIKQVCNKMTAQ
ncbi:MAG: hypothetical protein EBR02_00725 [Alphaproteobacteria bacterium]|nr:hypothetical protein [Alphaproteobacteria bacterium]